ncbi:MAG: hypothetical protein AAF234_15995 [Pseudomonadota bacterium]
MSNAYELAARAVFDDPNISRAAVYLPPAGDDVPCRVIVQAGAGSIQTSNMPVFSNKGRALEVLASVLTPTQGGVFQIGDDAWRVEGDPTYSGPNMLVWRCNTRLVET